MMIHLVYSQHVRCPLMLLLAVFCCFTGVPGTAAGDALSLATAQPTEPDQTQVIHIEELLIARAPGYVVLPNHGQLSDNREISYWQRIESQVTHVTTSGKRRGERLFDREFFALEPGEELMLELQPHQALRLRSPDSQLTEHDLEAWISNGSGLSTNTVLSASLEEGALVLAPGADNGTRICRIVRPPDHTAQIRLVLFTSSTELPRPPETTRNRMEIGFRQVEIEREISGRATMGVMEGLTESVAVIDGPAAIVLEHHLLYLEQNVDRLAEYRIAFRLKDLEGNHLDQSILEFTTLPEQNQRVRMDGKEVVAGKRVKTQMLIPEGSFALHIMPTRTLVAQLLVEQQPAYLFEALNRPESPSIAQQLYDRGIFGTQPAWYLQSLKESVPKDPSPSAPLLLQTARRLAVDNHYQPGGLVANMLLRRQLYARPGIRPHLSGSPELTAPNTFFRNVLPVHKNDDTPPLSAWFVTPRLKTERDRHLVVGKQHQDQLLAMLGNATFVSLPPVATAAGSTAGKPAEAIPQVRESNLQYNLPRRDADSLLRLVAFHPEKTTKLQVRFDNGKVHQLEVRPSPDSPSDRFRLDQGEAGLALLHKRFPVYDRTTLGGPFSLHRDPASFREVAFTEISLPADVKRLDIEQLPGNSEPLQLALQYKAARFHSLSESDFLQALELIGGRSELRNHFNSWLRHPLNPPGTDTAAELKHLARYDLENDYFPLINEIRSLMQTYTQSVSRNTGKDTATAPLAPEAAKGLLKKARKAADQQQWLVALEHYAELQRATRGKMKMTAALGHTRALVQLGEHYLAELMLKGMYLHPQGADGTLLARQAYEELVRMYTAGEREDKLLQLYCVEFYRSLSPELIGDIASLFAQNGSHRHAMLLSLLHPAVDEIAETLLYNALVENWPKLYGQTLQQLKSAESRNYFEALARIRNGEGETTDELLNSSGKRGLTLLEARQEAQQIHSSATRGDIPADEIRRLRQQWLHWQHAYPGPFHWDSYPGLIADYSGTAALLGKTSRMFSQYYRADVNKPVSLRAMGPGELRITVRPVHTSADNGPLNGWIEILDGAGQVRKAINNNLASTTLELLDGSGNIPGQREVFTIQVPAGEHRLQIRGRDLPLLVEVERKRPVAGCEILPPLTPETLAAVTSGQMVTPPLFQRDNSLRCLTEECLQFIDEIGVAQESAALIRQNLLARTAPSPVSVVPAAQQFEEVELPELKTAITTCMGDTRQDQENCLAMLALYSEIGPEEDRQWLVTQAQRIYSAQPDRAELAELLRRSALKSSWQQVELMTAESGMRFVEYTGWQPVSPFLRTRRTMLPQLSENEEILYSDNRLIYSIRSSSSVTLHARVQLVEVPYLPPAPLTAVMEWQGGPKGEWRTREFTLDGTNNEQTLAMGMPAGEHQLIFSLKNRYSNQFLTVQIESGRSSKQQPDSSQTHESSLTKERAYYVASHEHPVQASIEGPAMIRIDRLRAGKIHSTYRYMPDEWQQVAFKPDRDEAQALYRIYKLQAAPQDGKDIALLRPAPEPSERLAPLPPQSVIQLRAPLTVKNMQVYSAKGTMEFNARYVRRRTSDEEEQAGGNEDFFESSVTHRYRATDIPAHWNTKLLWRVREDGGPVFGLQEDFSWYPQFFPATIKLEADLYLQDPSEDGDFLSWPRGEYSLFTRASVVKRYDLGEKWYHIPSFSLFKRFLSLDTSDAYPVENIDRDIFTSYKENHQDGVRLGDTLYHRPWLDTLWFAGVSVGSNELSDYLAPDNGRVRVGWKQLIGSLQADATYRGTYYFNDEDRSGSSYSDAFQFDLNWDIWWNTRHRLQLSGRMRHDLQDGGQEWYLGVSYYLNDPPNYRHFKNAEVDFKDLRTFARQQQYDQKYEKNETWR